MEQSKCSTRERTSFFWHKITWVVLFRCWSEFLAFRHPEHYYCTLLLYTYTITSQCDFDMNNTLEKKHFHKRLQLCQTQGKIYIYIYIYMSYLTHILHNIHTQNTQDNVKTHHHVTTVHGTATQRKIYYSFL